MEAYKVYHDNDKIYPLADELVNSFSEFLESKGIWFFNEDSDEYQMKNRYAIYGEDFRVLQEMIQIVLDKRKSKETFVL